MYALGFAAAVVSPHDRNHDPKMTCRCSSTSIIALPTALGPVPMSTLVTGRRA